MTILNNPRRLLWTPVQIIDPLRFSADDEGMKPEDLLLVPLVAASFGFGVLIDYSIYKLLGKETDTYLDWQRGQRRFAMMLALAALAFVCLVLGIAYLLG